MFAKKKLKHIVCISLSLLTFISSSATPSEKIPDNSPSLSHDTLANELGWVSGTEGDCSGYFYDQPFSYPESVLQTKKIEITSNEGLYAQRGTSTLENKVTVTRMGQQLTGNRAYLYRDPTTGKLSAIEMIGNVHLREPNTLILAKKALYNFQTNSKTLTDIAYRTALIDGTRKLAGPSIPFASTQEKRKITDLTAWGSSKEIISAVPRRFELTQASYSTCPPTNPSWQLKAGHLVLDKNTGRGYATNARLLVKNVPVFYTPYINFPIDKRRQTGFLWPTIGGSNKWGPYATLPFYWNLAPNYDMTITPGMLSKRGVQLSDTFRYLTGSTEGNLFVSALPNDRAYAELRRNAESDPASITPAAGNTDSVTQAELNRIINSSTTRSAIFWRNDTRLSKRWSTHFNINYVSDDYYLHDFGNSVSDITQNQLLQEAELKYKGPNWNFTGRFQAYQTLHPVEDPPVLNVYRRFPQLILNGDYPNQKFGLEYFITTEATNFTILQTPGVTTHVPEGKRANLQPGISLPIYRPSFYLNPRVQFAFTNYYMTQTTDTNTPSVKTRGIPIFDVAGGLTFTRDTTLFKHLFQQTLEPQLYYVYIPYRNQNSIPTFDTTVNTLTYDQLFNYNRFSGIDRIGDANQLGWGLKTRLIDEKSGTEISRFAIGQIIYFQPRRVTLCDNLSCSDNPTNPSNQWRVSPLSALFNLTIAPHWSMDTNSIWSTTTKQLANASVNLHYAKDDRRVLNFGYGFVYDGDVFSGNTTNNSQNNIKITDFSFAWPLTHDISAVGRWTQDWREDHFQNLLYGLQYETCCWAVRAVGGRAFVNMVNDSPQYNSQYYIQFALKGLGNIGTGNPAGLLGSITGYNTQFGQEL